MGPNADRRALQAVSLLLAAADDLIASDLSLPAENRRAVAAAYSWWQLVHRQVKAVLLLQGNGYVAGETAPLMRNIFNHAFAVHWLIDNGDDAVDALIRAGVSDREKMTNWLTDTGWPVAEAYKALAETHVAPPDLDAAAHARVEGLVSELANVATMFDRYGAKGIYPVYKHLSGLSHTSMSTASLYWAEHPETGEAQIRAVAAGTPGEGSGVHLLLALLQVDSAFSPLLVGDPLRSTIDRVLDDMGLTGLELLPERARQAEAKAKAKKRARGTKR